MKTLLMTLGVALGVAAVAQTTEMAQSSPKITQQSIIVNPVKPDLKVEVWTRKDPTGSKTPTYVAGDHIYLNVKVNDDAYVYLFNVDAKGTIDLILPNKFASGGNFLKANTTKEFPSKEDKFTFDIAGPAGVNKVLVLASKTELDLDQIAQFKGDQTTGFATVTVKGGQNGLAQALSIVVKPLPSQDWVTDTLQYQISAKVATPPQPTVTNTTTWKSTFRSKMAIKNVYAFYANQLMQQGFEEDTMTSSRGQVVGKFDQGENMKATLTVKQRPGTTTYDIVIVRQKTQ